MFKAFPPSPQSELSELIEELDAELQFHVEELADEYEEAGLSREEARRQALLKLGNPQQIREKAREGPWIVFFVDLSRDIRFAIRSLRQAGPIALIAVLALALGIGFSTTAFSFVYHGVLYPFPYRAADRLANISIEGKLGNEAQKRSVFSLEEVAAFRADSRDFEDVAGYSTWNIRYVHDGGADRIHAGALTPNAMEFFGMQPVLGRALLPSDSQRTAPPVVVLNYRFWKEHFNQKKDILGSQMLLGKRPRTIVGVMPQRFQLLGADLYLPVSWSVAPEAKNHEELQPEYFFANARLRPGVKPQAASAALDLIVHQQARLHPEDFPEEFHAKVQNWSDALYREYKRVFLLLSAAVALLLLISCSNAAGLLLVHASSRQREMAVRTALGAGRHRLLRQFFAESLVLATAGCLLGCLLAWGGLHLLNSDWIARNILCMEADITLDRSTLFVAVCLSFFATIAAGIIPALFSLRGNIQSQLGSNGVGVHASSRGAVLRSGLVIGQVSLSVILLVCAGLILRTFIALTHINFGIQSTNILSTWVPLPENKYSSAEKENSFIEEVLARIEGLPGAINVAESLTVPLYDGPVTDVTIPGKSHKEPWLTMFDACSTGYFETLGLQLVRGRLLLEADMEGKRHVAVINRALARKYFGEEDPLGREIKFNRMDEIPDMPHNVYFTIVGIVSDYTNSGIERPPMPEAFVPYSFGYFHGFGLLVRTEGDPKLLLNSIRRVLWNMDRDVTLTEPLTLEEYLIRNSYAKPRFGMIAFSICAGVGLLLSLIGIFTITAYTVSLLTHEIGLRMAMGARHADVLRMVLQRCLKSLGIGLLLGVAISLLLTPLLRSQLWGVSSFDVLTFIAVVLLLLGTGILAAYLPALRAVRVDPNSALRAE